MLTRSLFKKSFIAIISVQCIILSVAMPSWAEDFIPSTKKPLIVPEESPNCMGKICIESSDNKDRSPVFERPERFNQRKVNDPWSENDYNEPDKKIGAGIRMSW